MKIRRICALLVMRALTIRLPGIALKANNVITLFFQKAFIMAQEDALTGIKTRQPIAILGL